MRPRDRHDHAFSVLQDYIGQTEAKAPKDDQSFALPPALERHYQKKIDIALSSPTLKDTRKAKSMELPVYALYGEWEKLSHFADDPLSCFRCPEKVFDVGL